MTYDKIQFDVQGAPEWTNVPRPLSDEETAQVLATLGRPGGRVEAVKLYRTMTRATLSASVQFVDNVVESNP